MKLTILSLAIFLLPASMHSSIYAEDNKTVNPYTNGWFYLPGIDRNITECLVIELEDGEVLIELFPAVAPQHVQRIKTLAANGSYDGVAFHRVLDGFMAQTGDVQYGKISEFNSSLVGTGSSTLADIPSEFSSQLHLRGVCSMARSSDPNSANSQFFICLANSTFLDQQYTVWGQVISGMEYVDLIKKGESANNGAVTNPDSMKKVYIRQLDHTLISGWLYTDKNVFPYFYDATTKNWLFFDDSTGTPKFYDFQKNAWLGF